MFVQNGSTPMVLLLLLLVTGCVSGVFFANTDILNPTTSGGRVTVTSAYVPGSVRATDQAQEATAFTRKITQDNMAWAATATQVPLKIAADLEGMRITATAENLLATQSAYHQQATQEKANFFMAQTQVVRQQEQEDARQQEQSTFQTIILFAVIVFAITTFLLGACLCVWVIKYLRQKNMEEVVELEQSQTRKTELEIQVAREKRRLLELQLAAEARRENGTHSTHSTTTYLLKTSKTDHHKQTDNDGNIIDLPLAN